MFRRSWTRITAGYRISLGIILFGLLVSVPGNIAANFVTAAECRLLVKAGCGPLPHILQGSVFLALIVAAVFFAQYGKEKFAGIGVRAQGKAEDYGGRHIAADVLVLPISLPFNEEPAPSEQVVADRLDLVRRYLGRTDERIAGVFEGRDDRRTAAEWTIEDLCNPAFCVQPSSGPRVAMRRFAWQQTWRALQGQLKSGRRLRRIVVLPSEETKDLVDIFVAMLRSVAEKAGRTCIVENDAAKSPPKGILAIQPRSHVSYDDLERLGEEFEAITAESEATLRRPWICLEITGGTRTYCVAAALASVRSNVVMSYVLSSAAGQKLLHYDVEPRFALPSFDGKKRP